MDKINWDYVVKNFEEGKTHKEVSALFGINVNTFISWCNAKGISNRKIKSEAAKTAVRDCLVQVGGTYGRRLMTGYVKSQGKKFGEHRVMKLLHQLSPGDTERRKNSTRTHNPIPYSATHFGHKLHFDQNEKLLQYGVFHAACIDGFTSRIVRHVILHQKNNILIYDELYKPILAEYGIWDMVRVDYGTEWFLTLFTQDQLEERRLNRDKPSYSQTYSKQNLRIERWWVEVNKRVNYPIKQLLVELLEDNELIVDNETDKAFLGEILIILCRIGVSRLIAAWNNHHIPGCGVPVSHEVEGTGTIPVHMIKSGAEMAIEYRRNGGTITDPRNATPITDDVLLAARDITFLQEFSAYENVYAYVVKNDKRSFLKAVQAFIDVSKQYIPA